MKNVKKELDVARTLALGAGSILMRYYQQSYPVDWKAPGDPVTVADRKANDFIVADLRKRFPKDAILSEEEPDNLERLDHSRVWMVDPMDGTREFIEHRGEFAVMIGLVVDGIPRVGAVYQPTAGKLYYAAEGYGAFLEAGEETRRLKVSKETVASRMSIAVSRSHLSSRVEIIRQTLRIKETIRSGSVGLKVGLICEGRAHLYVHAGHRTHLWDTCGPEAILREAGGRLSDSFNHPLRYTESEVRNLHGIVASNGVIHDRTVRVTQAVIART